MTVDASSHVSIAKAQPKPGPLLLALIPVACMIGVAAVTRILRPQDPGTTLPIVLSLAAVSVAARQLRAFRVQRSIFRRLVETAAAVGATVLIAVPQSLRLTIVHTPVGALLIVGPILLHLTLATFRVVATSRAAPSRSLESAIGEYIPQNIARAVATEIAVLWHAFTWWRARKPKAGVAAFRYDKGVRPILWTLIVLGILEVALAHVVVVAIWGARSAWMVLALSEIAVVYLFGILSAVGKLPIELTASGIRVRAAMFIDEFVERENISRIEIGAATAHKTPGVLRASLFVAPNVILRLASPRMMGRPFRKKTMVDAVGVYVDEPEAFRLAAEKLDLPLN